MKMKNDLPQDEASSAEHRATTQAHKNEAHMPVIARCQRCGREFLTMPNDHRDWYGIKSKHGYPFCGGKVVPLND